MAQNNSEIGRSLRGSTQTNGTEAAAALRFEVLVFRRCCAAGGPADWVFDLVSVHTGRKDVWENNCQQLTRIVDCFKSSVIGQFKMLTAGHWCIRVAYKSKRSDSATDVAINLFNVVAFWEYEHYYIWPFSTHQLSNFNLTRNITK